MNKIISFLLLSLVSVSAFADNLDAPPVTVPEPETLALLAVGVLSVLVSRRKNK